MVDKVQLAGLLQMDLMVGLEVLAGPHLQHQRLERVFLGKDIVAAQIIQVRHTQLAAAAVREQLEQQQVTHKVAMVVLDYLHL